jgi:hypothetical protein
LRILGLNIVLVNPFGPVHDQLAVPVDVVDADKLNVLPLHNGTTFAITGVAGGFGSVKLNGPTDAEGQLFNSTYTFE